MAHTRLYIDHRLSPGAQVTLKGDKARYLGKVLRLRRGDEIAVFNGDDGEYAASLARIAKNEVIVDVGAAIDNAAESRLGIHLVQGVSRGERMDFVVQKATELGVKRITPVLTEYGAVKLASDRAAKRQAHWQKVANSACEQSGRVCPPLVDAPIMLKDWFGQRTDAAYTYLMLRPGAATRLADLPQPQTKLCLLVGPEGGFSQPEYEDAAIAGITSVSLGPRILRTETAAVAAIAVAQAAWGDL